MWRFIGFCFILYSSGWLDSFVFLNLFKSVFIKSIFECISFVYLGGMVNFLIELLFNIIVLFLNKILYLRYLRIFIVCFILVILGIFVIIILFWVKIEVVSMGSAVFFVFLILIFFMSFVGLYMISFCIFIFKFLFSKLLYIILFLNCIGCYKKFIWYIFLIILLFFWLY